MRITTTVDRAAQYKEKRARELRSRDGKKLAERLEIPILFPNFVSLRKTRSTAMINTPSISFVSAPGGECMYAVMVIGRTRERGVF
jgi:hypothetical protein